MPGKSLMNNADKKKIRVVITGSSGRVGRQVMRELMSAGFHCTGVDVAADIQFNSDGDFLHRRADLTDFGQTVDTLSGCDVVVHLANIAYPGLYPDHRTFSDNVSMNYNVFSAASLLAIPRVVWLSSSAVAGVEAECAAPERIPITEDQPARLATSYALSKAVSESTAAYFGCRGPSSFIGVRPMLVVYPDDHERLRAEASDPTQRRWHYWSYIDIRDLTRLLRLAVEAPPMETTIINATAADSTLNRATALHCAEVFPTVPCDVSTDAFDSLFSGEKAKRILGFEPAFSWRR